MEIGARGLLVTGADPARRGVPGWRLASRIDADLVVTDARPAGMSQAWPAGRYPRPRPPSRARWGAAGLDVRFLAVGFCYTPNSRRGSVGAVTAMFGRVGMWRGGGRIGLYVSAPFVWRCLNSRAMTPFPHPAHRTGRALLTHPALGQDITPSHTEGHELPSDQPPGP